MSKNKPASMILQYKMKLETYALLAKREIIVMACIAHNRTNKTIEDILTEKF